MQFNRVIDTILVVNITSGINISTFPLSSTEFSPNSNKIWKINNITKKSLRQPYVVNCSGGAINAGSGMFCYVSINDGVNEIPLCVANSSGVMSLAENQYDDFTSNICDDINFPLWINDASGITLNVHSSYSDEDTDNGLCVDFSTSGKASVYISLMEFNIVE